MKDGELRYTLTLTNNVTQKTMSVTFDSLDKLKQKIIGNSTTHMYDFINTFAIKEKELSERKEV